eukprot:CAMPEP_0169459582 /NCGR_PEP_ID=MMETSP1042-20121227/18029_1 /TAXON_ID=464988 /ORGANISM="Hemiselmis andersenii, Strain CCMP1180" /LENGTH=436 /DNA_ID=CAMNT_0009572013 /DNA_START=14 /DNA_END=1324 /DNA_ORIENTATION=+
MARGNPSPSGEEYVLYVDGDAAVAKKQYNYRTLMVASCLGSLMALALLALPSTTPTTLVSVGSSGLALADNLIRAAPTASEADLSTMLQQYTNAAISNMDATPTGQMLAMSGGIKSVLADSGKLCAKKDIIMAKFDALYNRLKAQSVSLNASDASALEKKNDALAKWLDGESAYRLAQEKVITANEGAKFAREQYEKYAATVKDTKARVTKMEASYPGEKADLMAERGLIVEVMRLLGIMDAVPLSDESKAAGGVAVPAESPAPAAAADAEKKVVGKPSKADLAVVKAKVSELAKKAIKVGGKQVAEVQKLTSSLASFAETNEVKTILLDMIKEIDTRLKVLDSAYAKAQEELKGHEAALVKYETQLVDLSNAADKATQEADRLGLTRQSLAADKKSSGEAYVDEHAAYLISSPPTEREMFIITVIKKKIIDFCAK